MRGPRTSSTPPASFGRYSRASCTAANCFESLYCLPHRSVFPAGRPPHLGPRFQLPAQRHSMSAHIRVCLIRTSRRRTPQPSPEPLQRPFRPRSCVFCSDSTLDHHRCSETHANHLRLFRRRAFRRWALWRCTARRAVRRLRRRRHGRWLLLPRLRLRGRRALRRSLRRARARGRFPVPLWFC